MPSRTTVGASGRLRNLFCAAIALVRLEARALKIFRNWAKLVETIAATPAKVSHFPFGTRRRQARDDAVTLGRENVVKPYQRGTNHVNSESVREKILTGAGG